MIFQALNILQKELNDYVMSTATFVTPGEPIVVLGNISQLENGETAGNEAENINGKVVVSLVNLEEEKRLKNYPSVRVVNGQTEAKNPPITVNAYLLFSANFQIYGNGLRALSKVIEFFQGKLLFTPSNSPGLPVDTELHMEIHTLNFEQINDLWGSLGGKQVPFVMYKMRNIHLERQVILQTSPPILEVDGQGQVT